MSLVTLRIPTCEQAWPCLLDKEPQVTPLPPLTLLTPANYGHASEAAGC
jgi:hypothetical protein